MGTYRQRLVRVLCGALAVLAAASCDGGSGRRAAPAATPSDEVVVASFNFPESGLLAEIYAQALAAAGVPARVEADLGTREMVMPAFQQGFVDLVPEYLGSALQAVAPGGRADVSDPAAAAAGLQLSLARWHGRVLTPSPAQDQNGLAVTRSTAERYGLRSISDLARLGTGLTLTGPPECPERRYCLQGLQDLYGLRVQSFLPLDTEEQRVIALREGVATVAVVFSTSSALADGSLVLLSDDRRLQPAENVTPIVSERALTRFGPRLSGALNRVSAQLTDRDLIFLNWRVSVAGRSPVAEAHGWLARRGFLAGG